MTPIDPLTSEPLKPHEAWLRDQAKRIPGVIDYASCPLRGEVFENRLVISIGIETLRYSIMMGESYRNEYADWEADITDPLAFAKRMAEMINDPEVQNAALGDLFDKLAINIAEEEHESIRLEEDTEFKGQAI